MDRCADRICPPAYTQRVDSTDFRSEKCLINTIFVPKNVDVNSSLWQGLLPIEVKAGENLKSKSLKTFYESFPQSYPIRISLSDYRKQDWLTNLPLYAACRVCEY